MSQRSCRSMRPLIQIICSWRSNMHSICQSTQLIRLKQLSAHFSQRQRQARNLAINAEIIMPEIIDVLLGKANAQMISIAKLALAKDANSVGNKIKERLNSIKGD